MRFLITFSPKSKVSMERILPLVDEEESLAWRFYREGFVRDFFMTDRAGTVIVIAEAASATDVRRRFEELPLVKAELVDYDVVELRPFTNWETLFSKETLHKIASASDRLS